MGEYESCGTECPVPRLGRVVEEQRDAIERLELRLKRQHGEFDSAVRYAAGKYNDPNKNVLAIVMEMVSDIEEMDFLLSECRRKFEHHNVPAPKGLLFPGEDDTQ